MRAFALLVASLLATGALAGCLGAKKEGDDPPGTTSVPPGSNPPGTGGGTGTPQVTIRAPLASTVTIDGPSWVASGTEVPVKAAAPSNAKGTVSYSWAIGPLPGTVKVDEAALDTKVLAPGASKTLKFEKAGVYAMHCHPHPYMTHNVTVVEGLAAATTLEVSIIDGASPNEYRFVPENIVVPAGATVTYRNLGDQPHTATLGATPEPALKLLPLKAESGSVKIEGDGWQRVVAIMTDGEGRLGIASGQIYTTATLPAFENTSTSAEFQYGTPAALPGEVPVKAQPKTFPVKLDQAGQVKITYVFNDAPSGAGAPENLAQVEGHFVKDGETQDTFTCEAGPDCEMSGKAPAGAYTLSIVPLQGASMTGTITIEVVYDLTPPPPAAPSAPADGHGGHAH